jgi:hypothetical protein
LDIGYSLVSRVIVKHPAKGTIVDRHILNGLLGSTIARPEIEKMIVLMVLGPESDTGHYPSGNVTLYTEIFVLNAVADSDRHFSSVKLNA